MVNINLAAATAETKRSAFPYKKSISLVIVLLLAVLIAYAAIVWYAWRTAKSDDSVNAQYVSEYADLMKGNAKDVYDFQNRMDVSKTLLSQADAVMPSLQEIEKDMAPGTYLSKYGYDGGKGEIKLSFVGDNYDAMAKQILNFKQSDFFAGVTTGDSTLDPAGKVDFEIDLKLK